MRSSLLVLFAAATVVLANPGDSCAGNYDDSSCTGANPEWCYQSTCYEVSDSSLYGTIPVGDHCADDNSCNTAVGDTCTGLTNDGTNPDYSICASSGGGGGLSCPGDAFDTSCSAPDLMCYGGTCTDPTTLGGSIGLGAHCYDDSVCQSPYTCTGTVPDGSGNSYTVCDNPTTATTCTGEDDSGCTSAPFLMCQAGTCVDPSGLTGIPNGNHCQFDGQCDQTGAGPATCTGTDDDGAGVTWNVCEYAASTVSCAGAHDDATCAATGGSLNLCDAGLTYCVESATLAPIAIGSHCVEDSDCDTGTGQESCSGTDSNLSGSWKTCALVSTTIACTGPMDPACPGGTFCYNMICTDPTTVPGVVENGDHCGDDATCKDSSSICQYDPVDLYNVCTPPADVAPYENEHACLAATDCKSGNCENNVCKEPPTVGGKGNGDACTAASECSSGYCAYPGSSTTGDQKCEAFYARADYSPCYDGLQCSSRQCYQNACVKPVTPGGGGNNENQETVTYTTTYTREGQPVYITLTAERQRGANNVVSTPSRTTSGSRTASGTRSSTSATPRNTSAAQKNGWENSAVLGMMLAGLVAFFG